MLDRIEEKLDELKAYFEREMPGYCAKSEQTDNDFNRGVWSFFFIPRGKMVDWDWCIKISRELLEDYGLPRATEVLESYQWKARLQAAPHGSFFDLDRRGSRGPSLVVPS